MPLTIENVRKLLDEKFEKIDEKLSAQDIKLNDLKTLSEGIDTKFIELRKSVNEVSDTVKVHSTKLDEHEERLLQLENELDDQINRNMRNSLIFKGIPEVADESWEQTKNSICNFSSKIYNTTESSICDRIERAHRRGKRINNHHRPIFARFYCSEDVKYYNDKIRHLCINKKNEGVTSNLQFSKRLKERRNTAMMERKRLKSNNEIISGYIEYPATLMVKRAGDQRFKVEKKF